MVENETGSDAGQELSPEQWDEFMRKYGKTKRKGKLLRPLCKGVTVFNTPCQTYAGPNGYCRFHDPTTICQYQDGGQKCKRVSMVGAQFCQHHLDLIGKFAVQSGPSRIRLPSFLKYLPTNIAERAEQIDRDPDITNLRHDIVLLSTRLSQLLEGVSNPVMNYHDMLTIFDALCAAYYVQDDKVVKMTMERMRTYLVEGAAQREVWQEIYEVLDRRQRVVVAEHKQVMDDGGMIPVQQVVAMMTRLLTVVATYVPSQDALHAIRAEFDRIALLERRTDITLDAEQI